MVHELFRSQMCHINSVSTRWGGKLNDFPGIFRGIYRPPLGVFGHLVFLDTMPDHPFKDRNFSPLVLIF
jgi:hypothetical protein